MDEMQSSYTALIDRLDRFIRKYYANKLIRGVLYWIAVSLIVFLLYSLLENSFYFSKGVRKFLFFSFIGVSVSTLFYWIVLPALQIFRLGTRISHDQAAQIIGDHFTDVRDRLLNILQLHRQASKTSSPELALASIHQKTESLRLIPFRSAIDLTQNKKYLRYALPPLLILLSLLFAAPSVIRDSTARIIHNNEDFERNAPFHFVIENGTDLSVVQYGDFDLAVHAEGATLPNEVFITIDDFQYRMKKESPSEFTYRFKNVNKDLPFQMTAGRVASAPLLLRVLKKPNLVSFSVQLDYPSYTGRRDETLQNIGDLVIPAGTDVTWDFNTLNTEQLQLKFSDNKMTETKRKGEDLFSVRRQVNTNLGYGLFLANSQMPGQDSVSYSINVIPDLYPTISVESFPDTTNTQLVYFVGSAGDDYGFTGLTFNYQITDENGQSQPVVTMPLHIQQGTQFPFTHTFDISDLQLLPGQELTYYFEVRDNDAINGGKATRSNIMKYRKPTEEEYAKQAEGNNSAIKQSLEESMMESQRIHEELQKLREQLLQENQVDWQSKKELEKLMERQKALQEKMQNSDDLMNQNLQNQEEYSSPSQELKDKQQKLQDFFDKLDSEDQKKLMQKFDDMMDQLEKKDALDMLKDFDLSEEELQKQLDRLLELFKQLEVEQDLQQQIDQLQKLADQQEDLSKKTEQQQQSNEDIQKNEEELQNKLEDLKEQMDSIEKKNQALERPKDLEGADEEMDKTGQDMQNSQEQLQQNQNQKAAQSQKNAAQRMRNLAQQMSSQMQQGQMAQMQEDMATLRQLLENLVTLSFDQESLINQFNHVNVTTPQYVSLVKDQFKLKSDFKVAEDTLQALSKRVIQIESYITEKVTDIKSNLNSSLDELEDRQKAQAEDHQQRTMKNLNDLALMLSEVMNQMQQQMASMMPGNQMCNNPGGQGSGSPGRVPSRQDHGRPTESE